MPRKRGQGHGVPDGIWNLTDSWLSFEAKTNVETDAGYIALDDIRQTSLHKNWVKTHYNLNKEKDITLIMVCPKQKIEQSSQYASEGIYLAHPETILEIANSLEVILRGGLQILKYGDVSTLRSTLASNLMASKLSIDGLKEKLTQRKLYDLV